MRKKEALLNEIKGSLFEYLVARFLSQIFSLEGSFLKEIPADYQEILEQQDYMTREVFHEMVHLLPVWAKMTAEKISERLHDQSIKKIQLVGLYNSKDEEVAEADIMIHGERVYKISLKLNKRKGSVNTKSGGIKSFLANYFPSDLSASKQESFSQMVDSEFSLMKSSLYQLASLEEDTNWSQWRQRGLSELPGELPDDFREVLHGYYARLARELGLILKEIERSDPAKFTQGLIRLCGMSDQDVIQGICFHDIYGKNPEQVDVVVHDYQSVFEQVTERAWVEQTEIASCEIKLKDWMLQIRIKPMNKFTTTSIKINCSLRF